MTNNFDYEVKILQRSDRGSSSSCAHIGISLNNSKHVGKKLHALLAWASQKYEQLQLDIYDDIHAYNIQLEKNLDYSESLQLARKDGDRWVQENYSILSQFPHIHRYKFADLSASLPLKRRIQELQNLYIESNIFRDMINEDIYGYISRLENRGSVVSREKRDQIINLSQKYILDELALMSLLNEQESFVEIYAGQFLDMLNNSRRFLIEGLPEGLKNYHIIEVDFIRREKEAVLKDAA